MVYRDHSSIIWQEANSDQRLVESRDWLRFIVKTEKLGNIEIINHISFVVNEHD